MGFFDNVAETLKNTGREVDTKARDFAETTKIKNEISSERRKMKQKYEKIGSMYVQAYGDNADDMFKDIISEIRTSEKIISERENLLNQMKNTKACPSCGASVPKSQAFCGKCGTKVD